MWLESTTCCLIKWSQLKKSFSSFGESDVHVGEIFLDELLGGGRELGDGDRPVVVGADDGLQREEANEQNEDLFHGIIGF